MRHGAHMNESWHTYEWVMVQICMSHGTCMNESWHTYEWAMAHIWMRHGTPINASWHTYEWVMAHTWMSHGTCMNESWHTHEHDSTSSRRTTRRESLGGFVDRGVSCWVWTPSIHEHTRRLEHPPIHEHNESLGVGCIGSNFATNTPLFYIMMIQFVTHIYNFVTNTPLFYIIM